MSDGTMEAPRGASLWEEQMVKLLVHHVDNERELLDEYVRLAAETTSKAFAYLVNLLIDDEVRHHRLFVALAESLRADASLLGEEPPIPHLDFDRVDRERVIAASERLIVNEETDLKELKRLRRELHDLEDTTIWSLLVELMQRDTDKHIAMLEFVHKHASRRR